MLSQTQLEDLNRRIIKGRGAASIIESEFYREVLLPYLDNARVSIAMENASMPIKVASKKMGSEEMVILSSVNAGRISMIEDLVKDLKEWVAEGQQAFKIIEKESEGK